VGTLQNCFIDLVIVIQVVQVSETPSTLSHGGSRWQSLALGGMGIAFLLAARALPGYRAAFSFQVLVLNHGAGS
jgi:hypothetical protein